MARSLPFLREPAFLDGSLLRHGDSERELTADEVVAYRRLISSSCSLGDLVDLAGGGDESSRDERAAALLARLRKDDNLVGAIELPLPDACDILVVEQGYGGVYVHTVELVRRLRRKWRVVLFSPVDPLFEDTRHEDDFTLPRLQERVPGLTYFSYVHILRSVVKSKPCKLLMLMHRSQSLLLYDCLAGLPTVIYCDGYHDAGFRLARECRFEADPELDARILRELFHQLGSAGEFRGLFGSPSNTIELLVAGNLALFRATENWCWGAKQHEDFSSAFPELAGSMRFVPPFTCPEIFAPERVDRARTILFTTTMHNIDKKGLPELVAALARMPDARARCVVRQPDRLPPIPSDVRARLSIETLSKTEMVTAYHHAWLNCRTSREESSPVSILEGMVCELPQIVSPAVAEQIPILSDGKTGFVVDPDDVSLLVRRMTEILRDARLRDEMGRAARRAALEYSLERRLDAFERLLA